MSDKHENIYIEPQGKPTHKPLIFLGIVVGLGLLTVFLIWLFTHGKGNGNGYGSPGNWSQEQLAKYKQTSHNTAGLPSSLLDCVTNQVAKKYSYSDAMAKKISDDDQKKFMNMCLGSAGHWNKDIRNFFIQKMQSPDSQKQKPLSEACATCVIDGISQTYSPLQFISCSEGDPSSYCTNFKNDIDSVADNCLYKNKCQA